MRLPFANVQRLAAAAQEADPNEWRLKAEDEVRDSPLDRRHEIWHARFRQDAIHAPAQPVSGFVLLTV